MSVRALVAHGPGDLRLEHRSLPAIGAGEALVRIAYGGICGSDLHYWRHGAVGESVLREPMVLGHEVVGVVEQPAASGRIGRGTKVAVHPARRVGDVGGRHPEDRPNLAPDVRYLGSAAHLPHTDGGFAEAVALDERMLRPIPDHVELRDAALAEPAAVAWHAVRRAGDLRGARVLVVGCGPIGLLAIAAAREAGAGEVIATDLHERPRRAADRLGADAAIDARASTAELDADIVIESSGTRPGLEAAVLGCTRGGRVVLVGLQEPGLVPAPIAHMTTREIDLIGSFRFHDELSDVLQAIADGRIDAEAIITHEFALEDFAAAFETAADAASSGKVLLRF